MWFWWVQNWHLHCPFVSFQGKVATQMNGIRLFIHFIFKAVCTFSYFSIVFVTEMFIIEQLKVILWNFGVRWLHKCTQSIETKRINFWLNLRVYCVVCCVYPPNDECVTNIALLKFIFETGARWIENRKGPFTCESWLIYVTGTFLLACQLIISFMSIGMHTLTIFFAIILFFRLVFILCFSWSCFVLFGSVCLCASLTFPYWVFMAELQKIYACDMIERCYFS